MPLEMVIGLETHVELQTHTKAFCGCANRYGAPPNTLVCPICMGLPGALPLPNAQAVRLSVLAGMALNCEIHTDSRFDRKNYFYPDMPKAYQITQFYRPLCENGALRITVDDREKTIHITRIHMEEDAGKLLHRDGETLLDLNRCGVPLIEIVTEPEIASPQEAVAYLRELRTTLTFAGVSRCRMNEGSLRCDVNISVHERGTPFGERCEIKNLNSFQAVDRAIRAEYERQCELVQRGETPERQTRRFDEKTGRTVLMRRKEDSADYRYFPEPDLPPLHLSNENLRELRTALPPSPAQLRERMLQEYGISPEAARLLTAEKWLADYALALFSRTRAPAAAARLLTGEGFRLMNLRDTRHTGEREAENWPVRAERLAVLANLLDSGDINATTAKKLLERLTECDFDPAETAEKEGLTVLRDEETLCGVIDEVCARNEETVRTYRSGKSSAAKALMGQCMGALRGRADPKLLEEWLLRRLNGGT